MKKGKMLLCALLPAMMAIVTSCSDSDEDFSEFVTEQAHILTTFTDGVDITTYNRLNTFFNAELHRPIYHSNGTEDFGFFGELEYDDQPCHLINSRSQFENAYHGLAQLPEVDFNKYSILVGRTYRIDGSERLESFSLVDKGHSYQMVLNILHNINPDYGYTMDIGDLFYWQLLPKKTEKTITVERRVIKKVVTY